MSADGATPPDAALANAIAKEMANLKIEVWRLEKVIPYDNNPRKIGPDAVAKVAESIRQFGFNVPIVVDEDSIILAGHTRRLSLIALGVNIAAVIVKRGLSAAEKAAWRIADNRVAEESGWDTEKLQAEMKAVLEANLVVGFNTDEMAQILNWQPGLPELLTGPRGGAVGEGAGEKAKVEKVHGSLADKFGVPPFSVLNAREGWWQDRKRAWVGLGIASELGRGADMLSLDGAIERRLAIHEKGANATPGGSAMPAADYSKKERGDGRGRAAGNATAFGGTNFKDEISQQITKTGRGMAFGAGNAADTLSEYDGAERGINGTSIFDPVLTELAYRWFSPPGGVIIDPFAGGSVRGIVASHLGRQYHGVDLRPEQIEANKAQLAIAKDPKPDWRCGDSRQLDTILPKSILADFIFTCPPYADLEVYSDHPADLSAMDYPAFLNAYKVVIQAAADRLKPSRFAAVVIGDVRDPQGHYRGLVNRTVEFFEAAGLRFYNEAILVTAVGSLPVRAPRAFASARKLGKTHQQMLVFIKGDAKVATEAIGDCEFGEISEEKPAAQAGVEEMA